MSVFDQTGEQYGTATTGTPEYNRIGWFAKTTLFQLSGWKCQPAIGELRTKAKVGGQRTARETLKEVTIMSDDLLMQRVQNSPQEERALRAHRIWEERGCPIGSPQEDWFRAEEEIRSEQGARDEEVRARNKRVRAPRSAPGPDGPPAFSDHSGQL
jgi:hypothetical protein